MKNQTKWYGVLKENRNIFFTMEGFYCVLVNAGDIKENATIVVQHHGFIIGKVLGGKRTERYIFIYIGKDIKIREKQGINTWLYITSASPEMEKFQAISFKGGILEKLLIHSNWTFPNQTDRSISDIVKSSKNYLMFPLNNKKIKGNISISAGICESMSLEKGPSLSTTSTELEISFDDEKGIETFEEIYGYILNLCQFMVFRKNIQFEEIVLKKAGHFSDYSRKVAACHIKVEGNTKTKKGILQCIPFNLLEEHVDNLLDLIINSKERKAFFNIEFLPQEDEDAQKFTSMRIREVISAVETELDANGIEVQEDKEFDQLIARLKEMVKDHRKGEIPLKDPQDYDFIFGMLDQMKGSLTNRILKFEEKYHPLTGQMISKTKVAHLTKYRNEITHGGFFPLDQELADTSFFLMELIYCSILKRIGIEDRVIKDLIRWRVLS